MSNATATRPSYFYISALTVFSSFAVVMLHCNGIFWQHRTDIWLSSCLIETLFYFAVPVFFMITGATLIDYKKRYSTHAFFRKRLERTVIPFLIWSCISVAVAYGNNPGIDLGIGSVIEGIMNQEYTSVYWFFMPLFAIYLSIPILADIEHKTRTFRYMAIVGCMTISLFSMFRHQGVQVFPAALDLPTCGGFLLYPILGYLLHHEELQRGARYLLYAAGITGFFMHFISCWYFTPDDGPICGAFKNYLYLTTVAQACAVFVWVKYHAELLEQRNWCKKIIRFIQPATLSIYLSHIYLHYTLTGTIADAASLLYRTVGAVLLFATLAIAIRLLQRVPVLRRFFP